MDERDDFLLTWSHEKIMKEFSNDYLLARTANDQRLKLPSSPEQSEFRVYALLLVKLNTGKAIIIEGTNAEQGYIGGAICAERAALVQLRRFKDPQIMKVVVVTDSAVPIAPGLLCREFLSSHCPPQTPILIANNFETVSADADADAGTGSAIGYSTKPLFVVKSLGDIFPYPYIYRNVRRNDQVRYAMDFCTVINSASSSSGGSDVGASGDSTSRYISSKPSGSAADETQARAQAQSEQARVREQERALVELAKEVAAGSNNLSLLHPLQFGAACLFDDNTIETAYMLKGLEYGCTVDPVSLLIREMSLRHGSNMIHAHRTGAVGDASTIATQYRSAAAPKCLAMVDQLGVAHAPFAPARALLIEHGFENCGILYHNEAGVLIRLEASELAPNSTLSEEKGDGSGKIGTRSLLCSDFFSKPQ